MVASRDIRWPLLAAVGAALAWLPFVDRPATPDEGGYLLVASQWHAGTSLYGDYWVDRPPLLITIYRVADALGGVVALRLLGIAAVVISIVLGWLLARRLRPGSEGYAAVATAAFMSTPLFGGLNVNGELFAVPLLLGGVLCLVRAWSGDPRWWLAAGALGAAAALVKQSQVDLVVLALVLLVALARRDGARSAVRPAALLLAGGLAVTAALVGWAALHGTSPGGLWEAVVAFRFKATATIGTASGTVTTHRAFGLVGAFLASGAPLVIVLLLGGRGGRPGDRLEALDPRFLALPLLAWELFGVAVGGSYWLHYLVGLVPGLVCAIACLERRRELVTGFAAVSAVVSVVVFAAVGGRTHPDDIAAYLRSHDRPGDTVTVAFGRANIVHDARMSSPYDELWSLPVRVRDPHLASLTRVLAGPDRPTWLVVAGTDLTTWGVTDVAAAQAQVDLHYSLVRRFRGYLVYHVV